MDALQFHLQKFIKPWPCTKEMVYKAICLVFDSEKDASALIDALILALQGTLLLKFLLEAIEKYDDDTTEEIIKTASANHDINFNEENWWETSNHQQQQALKHKRTLLFSPNATTGIVKTGTTETGFVQRWKNGFAGFLTASNVNMHMFNTFKFTQFIPVIYHQSKGMLHHAVTTWFNEHFLKEQHQPLINELQYILRQTNYLAYLQS